MKKIIFWLFLGFTLTGCTTVVSDLEMETIDVYVDASDWKYTNYTDGNSPFANNYFYATVEVPEISRAVFTDGEVKAYVVYDRNTPNASKHILPYVRHYEELLSDGSWHYYTETVDCMYGPGWVEFNYRASDFAYEDNININPVGMHFSIVITKGY